MFKLKQYVKHMLFGLLFGCPLLLPATVVQVNDIANSKPIFQADPTIFFHKGIYYLYGTNDGNSGAGFVLYSSKDKMKSWSLMGPALSKGDAFGDRGFWAPQVWAYQGKFYMAYTANEKIAIAESDTPYGPFKQKDKRPLVADQGQIDPFVFIDTDGKKYMYYVRLDGGNKICVAEMTDDFSALKKNTEKLCITAEAGTWEHVNPASATIAEGPTVMKRAGKYYLFYSANDFRNKDYAVGYAVSSSVYGPWIKHSGNPIIHQSLTENAGSGHGDILKEKNGSLLYVFHTHNQPNKVGPRKTAVIKLKHSTVDGTRTFSAISSSFKFLTTGKD